MRKLEKENILKGKGNEQKNYSYVAHNLLFILTIYIFDVSLRYRSIKAQKQQKQNCINK